MEAPANALEFLKELGERYGKQSLSSRDLHRYLDYKAREKGVPLSGQFELTPLCNFDCGMCYVHLTRAQLEGRSVLGVDVWKGLMHEAWEAGMLRANLTGGECLAYPGFEELYLYLHSLGVEVGVLTNGFLLDEERVRFFQKHMPAQLQITLYGWNDDVYERVTCRRAFGTVRENALRAMEAGLPVYISVTPSAILGEDVLETVRMGRSLGKALRVNSALFAPRAETGRSPQEDQLETEMYIRIYRLLNELDGREVRKIDEDALPPAGGPDCGCAACGLTCGAGRSSFVIDWQGAMVPCNRMEMIRAYPLEEGFAEAWRKVNRAVNGWPRVPACEGCVYRPVCNTCAGNQLRFAEPGQRPEALCEQTRRFMASGVRHMPECD